MIPRLLAAGLLGTATVLALAPTRATAAPVTLITRNDTWSWYAGPTDPGAGWQTPSPFETGWSSGAGILGYGEAYVTTTIPFGGNPLAVWTTTYFRKEFYLDRDPATLSSLRLAANYDDGFVLYVNGHEVVRRSMPAGPVSYGTFALDHEGGAYESIDLVAALPYLIGNDFNVVAVEVHQRAANSSDLVWDGELEHSVVPTLTRGPYLQMGGPHAMTVRWRTDLASNSRVWYGGAPYAIASVADDPAVTTEHEVRVTALPEDSRWYYAVGTSDAQIEGNDEDHTFRTSPAPGSPGPTRIWVIGDAGWNSPGQIAVRDAYSAYTAGRPTNLWLMLGDNAYNSGLDSEYQAGVFDVYRSLLRQSPLWPTRGNHDILYDGPGNDYYDHFTLPTAAEAGGLPSGTEAYYSFDYANIHFICLDSEGTDRSPNGAMMSWLRQDVAATNQTWILAYWHHPPYSHGGHNSDNDLDSEGKMGDMRRNALPILDSTGVDVVLSGHSHSYERSFLLNGHYGPSSTLAPAMIVDGGTGQGADGAYVKRTLGSGPFEGAVYVVDGSSGNVSGGLLNHPVMVSSQAVLGSFVIDVAGNRLDARFLTSTGAVTDSFTILKGPGFVGAGEPPVEPGLRLALASPNPSGSTQRIGFTLPRAGRAHLAVLDATGRRVATLVDGNRPAGLHQATWAGRDARGRAVAPGVYFAVLEFGGERRASRLVRTP